MNIGQDNEYRPGIAKSSDEEKQYKPGWPGADTKCIRIVAIGGIYGDI